MACPVSMQRSLKVSSSFLLCMCWRTFGGVNTNYSPLIVVCSVWDVAFHPLGVKEMFLLLRVHVLVAPCTSWLYNDPQTLKQSFTNSSLCTLCYSLYMHVNLIFFYSLARIKHILSCLILTNGSHFPRYLCVFIRQ